MKTISIYEKIYHVNTLFCALLKSDKRNHNLSTEEKNTIENIKKQYEHIGDLSFIDECEININESDVKVLINLYQRICKENMCKDTPIEHFQLQQKGIMYSFTYPIARVFGLELENL